MIRKNIIKLRASDAEVKLLDDLWRCYQLSDWGDVNVTKSDVIRIALTRELQRVKCGDVAKTCLQTIDTDIDDLVI